MGDSRDRSIEEQRRREEERWASERRDDDRGRAEEWQHTEQGWRSPYFRQENLDRDGARSEPSWRHEPAPHYRTQPTWGQEHASRGPGYFQGTRDTWGRSPASHAPPGAWGMERSGDEHEGTSRGAARPLGPAGTSFGAARGKGPKGYRRSDERIREDVIDRIVAHGLDASEVEITVKEGEVSLSGTVRDRRMKHAMEDIADQVSGVRDVHNQIRVRRDDDESRAEGAAPSATNGNVRGAAHPTARSS